MVLLFNNLQEKQLAKDFPQWAMQEWWSQPSISETKLASQIKILTVLQHNCSNKSLVLWSLLLKEYLFLIICLFNHVESGFCWLSLSTFSNLIFPDLSTALDTMSHFSLGFRKSTLSFPYCPHSGTPSLSFHPPFSPIPTITVLSYELYLASFSPIEERSKVWW